MYLFVQKAYCSLRRKSPSALPNRQRLTRSDSVKKRGPMHRTQFHAGKEMTATATRLASPINHHGEGKGKPHGISYHPAVSGSSRLLCIHDCHRSRYKEMGQLNVGFLYVGPGTQRIDHGSGSRRHHVQRRNAPDHLRVRHHSQPVDWLAVHVGLGRRHSGIR